MRVKIKVGSGDSNIASDLIAAKTGLSKGRVKDAMNKGAVWLRKHHGKVRRLRRASSAVSSGDYLEIYYDENLLARKPPEASCMSDRKHYSVWYKPAGLMSQGTMYGDHCSLVRQAEVHFGSSRPVFLVHRLDREAAGVMLLAHSRLAASKLSELFQRKRVIKRYRVEVLGNMSEKTSSGTIQFPLDGKAALTEFEVVAYDAERNTSTVEVLIKTGRLHQIRRHFDMIGFPVMGDPRYGKGNKNTAGLRLVAEGLRFLCPFSKQEVEFNLGKKAL